MSCMHGYQAARFAAYSQTSRPLLTLKTLHRNRCRSKCVTKAREVRYLTYTVIAGQTEVSEGDLIVVGDVLPGACLAANGDVLVFGR